MDIYGAVRKEVGEKGFVPQLYQGQYVDEETGLAYNRFRYYDSDAGNYISQDPIGLAGGRQLYNYVWNPNLYIDEYGLAGQRQRWEGQINKDGTPRQKPGPKTDPNAPHNRTIREWGDEVETNGGTVLQGGGREPERGFDTPGGHKSSRRPDIIWRDADGKVHWGNVGQSGVRGKPVPREVEAMQDLNKIRKQHGVAGRVQFRSYNHSEQNVKKHHH